MLVSVPNRIWISIQLSHGLVDNAGQALSGSGVAILVIPADLQAGKVAFRVFPCPRGVWWRREQASNGAKPGQIPGVLAVTKREEPLSGSAVRSVVCGGFVNPGSDIMESFSEG